MISSALQLLGHILSQCWRFFNGFYLPGTNVTPAALALFILFTFVVTKFIKRITKTDYHDDGGK